MTRHDRLSELLAMVLEAGSVHIDDVVAQLGVSAATARRDLDLLASQQLVTRTRGGASANPTSSELPLRYRTTRMSEEKTRIAHAAAKLVEPGQTISLNGGTTTTEIARELSLHAPEPTLEVPQVTVVTNAVNIGYELTVRSHVRVVMTGGVPRPQSYELVGPLAQRILPDIYINTLFLGVEALGPRGAYASHEGEAAINAALADAAETVVAVSDHSKLGTSAFALIRKLSQIDLLITDSGVDEDTLAWIKAAGVETMIV